METSAFTWLYSALNIYLYDGFCWQPESVLRCTGDHKIWCCCSSTFYPWVLPGWTCAKSPKHPSWGENCSPWRQTGRQLIPTAQWQNIRFAYLRLNTHNLNFKVSQVARLWKWNILESPEIRRGELTFSQSVSLNKSNLYCFCIILWFFLQRMKNCIFYCCTKNLFLLTFYLKECMLVCI